MKLQPKTLFLIDGFGALLSAFLLGVVLVRFEPIVGMPVSTLYLLAFLPCLFALYDLICYLKVKKQVLLFLKGIATANLLYCILSTCLVVHHYAQLTALGLVYFIMELIIVLILVILQFKTAYKESTNS
ncbi:MULTISPECIES: hypothetical protein [unclassified Aureispira]|uniref:hypothetical protein n=1 Tax=unclassified Aureispira TaxID=2649989 RepID=UPI000696D7CB|nr:MULTISPECIES: hypothetical protein [unclassified Aureispira]WMX15982.1 hypothetical protein QP953_06345 [Aureispira sp. CCB-E]